MIVASTDQITITDVELEVFEMAYEPKKLVMVQGDHYSAYLENFEKTSTAATEWFVKHLTG